MTFDATTAPQLAAAAARGNNGALRQLLTDLIEHVDGLSPAELAFADGVIAGAGAASKALVLDASGNIAMPTGGQFEFSNAAPAAAGSSAADATALTAQVNAVTGADGVKGVALPAAADGLAIYIHNTSATAALLVYPVNGGNDNINGLSEDAAFTMAPGRGAWFTAASATQWHVPDAVSGLAQISIPICGNAKVGATAGWVVTAGTNMCHATLPASQTGSTLVVPISGVNVRDVVTAVSTGGQVESAGGNVTLVMSVRKLTNAAGDNADAEIGTDNVGTLTADTALSAANLGVTLGTAEALAADESLYVLFTGTTAASTDIDLTHLLVTVRRAT
jgi:hypothetical protein